ncbi:2,3-bisphosphoglycerate-independent phosphoglycerate mutase [Rickettsiales endosymbiont of Stachyamoeba lipophora]|uniref:2,3-bisphosphoglycerate-independent phosphoglycerate mutase n=1 Tax=Rickettsiales endosymbiont of Stachyamoeba lipophora TaxID=2486578 RepID=UPI000F649B34|nr:2,3-bisphosphoglycerate-independent phosphoglycerate mutase [Rickettsiales endosymbiont of Stachyamoeba lipophora]AZL16426.1 2,3-bisphosphoglycerate-independent phosphoglycerate mutase [Rickettsiales endosymbiont of Stachyamoeba lipophora]
MVTPINNKVILCVLDGLGISAEQESNAFYHARTPFFDYLFSHFPNSTLKASGTSVGLPATQMGNSEVGHMTIGAGRIIPQDLVLINEAITNQQIATNTTFKQVTDYLQSTQKSCHILGLISDGGIHSHQAHLFHLIEILAVNNIHIKLHLILDGRDTPPKSALASLATLHNLIEKYNTIEISSIAGRFYSMDRNKCYERTELAHLAITGASANKFSNAVDYITHQYAQNITDEFILPASNIQNKAIDEGDCLICFNFRADRIRQILASLVDPEFQEFKTQQNQFKYSISLVEYSQALSKFSQPIFKPQFISNNLSEIFARLGLKQLKIAESEKYAHVTYFFNGGVEASYPNEERILIPSPYIHTYDLQPEMSAFEITTELANQIKTDKFDFILVNFANTDMVGHSGNFQAGVKAVEVIDECLSKLVTVALEHGYTFIITADHGNIEKMSDNNQPHTSHTTNLVPLIIASNNLPNINLHNGTLAGIAPTILKIMGLPQPKEMTGKVLI